MAERTRAPQSSSWGESLVSLEDVRRQLEGRLEVVEAARERYGTLEALLSRPGWKRRVRERPSALREVLGQESALEEALARVHRRAEVAGWPESLPVLATAREVKARRARLETLVRKRLGSLARSAGEASFGESLARLEALVLEPIPLEPKAHEVRLLEGQPGGEEIVKPLVLTMVAMLWLIAMTGAVQLVPLGLMPLVLVLLMVVRSGKFWLTSERLVWKPFLGEPVQVSLASLAPGSVRLGDFGTTVVAEGERTVCVRYVEGAKQLATALELHRHPPLRGSGLAGRLEDVACYEAVLVEGSSRVKGFAILRRGVVSFVPERAGTELLRVLTGAPAVPGLAVEVPWLIEQLRYLPSLAEFGVTVDRLVAAVGGVRWAAAEARHRANVPVWKDIRFTSGRSVLSGKVDWHQQGVAERLLANWNR
jgi:hypothetical protein